MKNNEQIREPMIPPQTVCSGIEGKDYWLCPFLNVENGREFCNLFASPVEGHRLGQCVEQYPDGATIKIRPVLDVRVNI